MAGMLSSLRNRLSSEAQATAMVGDQVLDARFRGAAPSEMTDLMPPEPTGDDAVDAANIGLYNSGLTLRQVDTLHQGNVNQAEEPLKSHGESFTAGAESSRRDMGEATRYMNEYLSNFDAHETQLNVRIAQHSHDIITCGRGVETLMANLDQFGKALGYNTQWFLALKTEVLAARSEVLQLKASRHEFSQKRSEKVGLIAMTRAIIENSEGDLAVQQAMLAEAERQYLDQLQKESELQERLEAERKATETAQQDWEANQDEDARDFLLGSAQYGCGSTSTFIPSVEDKRDRHQAEITRIRGKITMDQGALLGLTQEESALSQSIREVTEAWQDKEKDIFAHKLNIDDGGITLERAQEFLARAFVPLLVKIQEDIKALTEEGDELLTSYKYLVELRRHIALMPLPTIPAKRNLTLGQGEQADYVREQVEGLSQHVKGQLEASGLVMIEDGTKQNAQIEDVAVTGSRMGFKRTR